MAFTLEVAPAKPPTLLLTYWVMDNRNRVFDGEKIITEDLNKYKESRFYDVSYPTSPVLTKGKQQVKSPCRPGLTTAPARGMAGVACCSRPARVARAR